MTATVERQDIRPGVYSQVLEITWLAIIFLVPLFFNPLSHQAFYLNKALMLQFLVFAMLAFWVADWILSRAGHKELKWQGILTSPLQLTILVFGLVAILATATSITPAISLWGSYFRKAGLLTLICWILFFFIVAQKLRHRAQIFRAIYTLLLSSGIASLVGILQHFFPNILPNLGSTGRIFSTAGNALSLSAFLAMVIPFNLALIVHSWNKITSTCHPERQRRVSKPSARLTTSQILRSLRSRFFASLRMTGGNTEQSSHNRGKWANTIRLISLVILLALQFWCLWLAQYSITILLYIIAPIIFIILLGIVRRRRLILSLGAVSLLILGIIAGLLLVPLLFSHTSVESTAPAELEPVPVSEAVGLHTLGWRVQYWQSTINIVIKSPEVPFSNDRWHDFRRLIGYGPETFIVTFQLFLPKEMGEHQTLLSVPLTRPHNHYLYLATTMGLLGLMSFLSILAVFFYLCFRYLRRTTADIYKLLLIAMAAGMVQYMADIFFNPTTISPELVFWLSLGLVPVIGRSATSGELEKATALDSTETDNSQKYYVNKIRRYISAGCALLLILIGFGITIRPFLADMYLQKGFNFQARQEEQAVLAFDRAVTLAPEEAVYWHCLGLYDYSVARIVKEEALKTEILTLATNAFEKARELEPYIVYRYHVLADVYVYWAQAGATDKWQTALSLYDKASQLIPNNAIILNKWSLALIIKGDFDEARTKLDYAASIDPGWPETSFLSGLLLAREGKNDEAALQIMAPIKNKSANLDYFIDLCTNLATYDMVRPLQNALDAYVPGATGEWTGHAVLGVTSLFTGDLSKSLDELNSAVLAAPAKDVGGLFRAILRLSAMSPPLRAALPNVAEEWRDKLSQSPERDTLLPEFDQLISNPK
jgi:tetratricopeptide (TPR) repeat protein